MISVLTIITNILICLLFFFIETSEGKYLSPFHDIPLIAGTEEVSLLIVTVVGWMYGQTCSFFSLSLNRTMVCQPKNPRTMKRRYCQIQCFISLVFPTQKLYLAFYFIFRCSITWLLRFLDGQMLKWR